MGTLTDSAPTRSGLREAIIEALEYAQPEDEASAIDTANEAKSEYLDAHLIYHSDVLTLWDGSTMEEILERRDGIGTGRPGVQESIIPYDDLMKAVTASVFYQLEADWADEVEEAIDAYIDAHLTDNDLDLDRDEALAEISGPKDEEG